MNCLKCGRETDQTFCEQCRETMKKYPVKPGSFVLLPKRTKPVKRTPPRRDPIAPEVRIARLRRMLRRMLLVIVALLLLLASMGYAIYRLWKSQNDRPLGQNYSTVTRPTDAEEIEDTAEST